MNDTEIVELYWKRDEAAIAATAEVYGNYCYSVAYRLLSSLVKAFHLYTRKICPCIAWKRNFFVL